MISIFSKRVLLCFSIALFFVAPVLEVHAAPVIRTGDAVTFNEGQAIEGDLYSVAGSFTSSATVAGDAYIAGGTVTIHGAVDADLVVIGGTVQINAPVSDDVRVVGGNVVIGESVKGDVVVLGGDVLILSTADIGGDVLFYGGSLDVKGAVHGSVYGVGQKITIDSHIDKDVEVTAKTLLTIGARSNIEGDVSYKSPKELSRALESVIVGKITYTAPTQITSQTDFLPSIVPFLALLFASLVIRFMFGTRVDSLLEFTAHSYGIYGLVGFATLILTPIMVLLLFVSLLGMLVGLVTIFSYVVLLFGAIALAPLFVGAEISRYFFGKRMYGTRAAIMGTVAIFIISILPWIGGIAFLAVILMVMGGMMSRMYGYFR